MVDNAQQVSLDANKSSKDYLKAKPLQDYLNFVYSRTSNEQLARQLGSLGDMVEVSREAMNILNRINATRNSERTEKKSFANRFIIPE